MPLDEGCREPMPELYIYEAKLLDAVNRNMFQLCTEDISARTAMFRRMVLAPTIGTIDHNSHSWWRYTDDFRVEGWDLV